LKEVLIEDSQKAPFYSARIVRNVKVSSSPDWMKKKIEAMGIGSVNNIVDITNFLLFQYGQPLHAFDLDKIEGKVIVREASPERKRYC